MTERTKALNSTVSTLKKNPGRIGHLVKTAKALIVPPKQYAAGKTKKLLEAAIKKLKAKRGLNGAVDGGAGPFSDKVINKQLGEKTKVTSATGHKKEAMEQKRKDQVLAGSAVASGAALGGALAHDVKKSRIASRVATKGAYKHMGDASVAGAEKRLARASKVMARMGKPLRRAGIKGAVIGGLAGAALGAAHLKKQASEFLGKGKIPAGAKDVTPGAQPKAKAKAKVKPQATGTQLARVSRTQYIGKNKIPAGAKNVTHTLLKRKAGKIAAGVAAGSAIAYAAKKHLEKKAEKKKDSAIGGMAVAGGMGAYARRQSKDSIVALKGLEKQRQYITSKGGRIGPTDLKMALNSFKKPMARRALKSAGKGVVAGALVGAAIDKMKGKKHLEKKAAEKLEVGGKKYRKGTVTSAATKMGILGAVTSGGYSAKYGGFAGTSAIRGALGGAVTGGAYALARKALRSHRGEHSVSGGEFKDMKRMKRMKELMG